MSDIETRIAEILHTDPGNILSAKENARLAGVLVRELGLTEFTTPSPVAERWWATSIQHCDENGEWQWPTT